MKPQTELVFARSKRIAGFLAVALLLTQLAWAGHAQFHAPDNPESCHVCVHLDRLDVAALSQSGQYDRPPVTQAESATVAERFHALAVERPRVRAPPSA